MYNNPQLLFAVRKAMCSAHQQPGVKQKINFTSYFSSFSLECGILLLEKLGERFKTETIIFVYTVKIHLLNHINKLYMIIRMERVQNSTLC